MRLSRLRTTTLVSAASLMLAACAGQGTAPLQSSSMANSATATVKAPVGFQPAVFSFQQTAQPFARKASCDFDGVPYFMGPCIQATVKTTGTTFALKKYKGLTVSLGTGPNTQSGVNQFIVGEGTGKSDITGTSSNPFDFYGKDSHCVNPYGVHETCHGKELLYIEEANAGESTVTFQGTPAISITNTGKYPGKICHLDTFVDLFGYEYWMIFRLHGIVHGTKVSIPWASFQAASLQSGFGVPTHSILYWGVACWR